jgi:hypothetical protein
MLLAVGIFGTSLFYGDGVITPAISVLSAVEGLEVVSPAFKKYVIPLTLVVLFCLFAVQKRGTGGIGKFFGPITLVWFAMTIAVLGCFADPPGTPKSCGRSARTTRWASCRAARHHLHHPGRRGAVRDRAPRRCTPTWATLANGRFAWPGSAW